MTTRKTKKKKKNYLTKGKGVFFMDLLIWADTLAILLIGVAVLLHIRKEPKEAHGKTRS